MGNTKVRGYTDKQLLEYASSLPSFQEFPQEFWIYGIRSNENTPNIYDDKFYLFYHKQFIMVMSGSTNTGTYGLLNFKKWSKKGTAQIKANEWYYGVFGRGKHNGKVEALRQIGPFKVLRDDNMNDIAGDVSGWSWESNRGLNFHPNTYNLRQAIKRWVIGKWTVGCQVVNDIPKYVKLLNITRPQEVFTYCLVDEFE